MVQHLQASGPEPPVFTASCVVAFGIATTVLARMDTTALMKSYQKQLSCTQTVEVGSTCCAAEMMHWSYVVKWHHGRMDRWI
jgi:hypothetical protein